MQYRPPATGESYALAGTMRGTLEVGTAALAALEVSDPNTVPLEADRTPSNLKVWDLAEGAAPIDWQLNRVVDWSFDHAGDLMVRSDLHTQIADNGSFAISYYFDKWDAQSRSVAPFLNGPSNAQIVTPDVLISPGDAPQTQRLISRTDGKPTSEDFASLYVYLPFRGCCIINKTSEYQLEIRELPTGKLLGVATSPPPSRTLLSRLYGSFTTLTSSSDETSFLANAAGVGVTLYRMQDAAPLAHIDGAEDWRFQPDGDVLAVVTNQSIIELLSASTDHHIASLAGHIGYIAGLWFDRTAPGLHRPIRTGRCGSGASRGSTRPEQTTCDKSWRGHHDLCLRSSAPERASEQPRLDGSSSKPTE